MSKVENMMQKLGITEEEARELLLADAEIDADKKYTDDNLSKEQKAIVSEMSRATAKKKTPVIYNWEKGRNRKENKLKIEMIQQFYEFICATFSKDATITNKDNQVSFDYQDKSFSIKLIQHRKKERWYLE